MGVAAPAAARGVIAKLTRFDSAWDFAAARANRHGAVAGRPRVCIILGWGVGGVGGGGVGGGEGGWHL